MVLGDFKFLGVPCHSIGLDDLKVLWQTMVVPNASILPHPMLMP